ncbi:MAG: MFS transporter [Myxococcales bacterium]|nr:MFS transporter [Myxococcales bacterium]MCB9519328.1 MFS transporter [Myxococcales bacterium]MCB9530772.1 MFS transporter [Myxococcales bacterium]MCB9533334.1 MFS transporter [Myxococcales bacterium]
MTATKNASGEIRLKALYFTYLAAGGLAMTYWPLHFAAVGLSASAIGVLFGVRTAMTIVFQPWLTSSAERRGRPRLAVAVAFSVAAACGLLLPLGAGFWTLALPVWFAAPATATIVPLLDATIVRDYGLGRYGRFRLWGSAGFGVTVAGFGVLIAVAARFWPVLADPDASRAAMGTASAWAYVGMTGLGAALAWRGVAGEMSTPRPGARALEWPGRGFGGFVLASALHWAAVMVFNVFFTLRVAAAEMPLWVPGVGVGVAILGEIAAFWAVGTSKLGRPLPIALAVCGVSAFRWAVVAWAPSAAALIAVQALHFATFGVWFSLTMGALGDFAPPERRATVQGLLSALCFGVGGTASSLLTGAVFERYGGEGAFSVAVALELLAALAYVVVLPGLSAGWGAHAATKVNAA